MLKKRHSCNSNVPDAKTSAERTQNAKGNSKRPSNLQQSFQTEGPGFNPQKGGQQCSADGEPLVGGIRRTLCRGSRLMVARHLVICTARGWGKCTAVLAQCDPFPCIPVLLYESRALATRNRSGVSKWLSCWAHNPDVRGSKPRSAI